MSKLQYKRAGTAMAAGSARAFLPVFQSPKEEARGAALAGWLGVVYALLIVGGFILIRLPGATVKGNELSTYRAVFTVCNAATLTGFQMNTAVDSYGPLGQATVTALTAAGCLLTLIIGGLAVNRIVGMGHSNLTIATASVGIYLGGTLLGAALLVGTDRNIPQSLVQASSALANSGVIIGAAPSPTDVRTHVVLMGLAMLGAMGVPVLLELWSVMFLPRREGQGVSRHTRVCVTLMAALYLIGFFACVPWENVTYDWPNAIATGSLASLDARSAGLPIVPLSLISRMGLWALVGLMIAGACPGGTGGGIKVTALYELWRGTRRALAKEAPGRAFGIAVAWIAAYIVVLAATLLILLQLQPDVPGEKLLFIASSAVGTVGLSQDPIAISGNGLFVLSAAMVLGRALPLVVLWWAATTAKGSDVAIG